MVDKQYVMSVLEKMYDDWKKEEEESVKNGIGRLGIDGMTTTDKKKLFNQLVTLLEYEKAS